MMWLDEHFLRKESYFLYYYRTSYGELTLNWDPKLSWLNDFDNDLFLHYLSYSLASSNVVAEIISLYLNGFSCDFMVFIDFSWFKSDFMVCIDFSWFNSALAFIIGEAYEPLGDDLISDWYSSREVGRPFLARTSLKVSSLRTMLGSVLSGK